MQTVDSKRRLREDHGVDGAIYLVMFILSRPCAKHILSPVPPPPCLFYCLTVISIKWGGVTELLRVVQLTFLWLEELKSCSAVVINNFSFIGDTVIAH